MADFDEIKKLARMFDLSPSREDTWPIHLLETLTNLHPYLSDTTWHLLLRGVIENWHAAMRHAREMDPAPSEGERK
jgi:hypothetical protein